MKTFTIGKISFLVVLLVLCQCQTTQDVIPETGTLTFNLGLTIDLVKGGRLEAPAISVDDFKVEIYTEANVLAKEFARYADLPAEISLPKGNYYIVVHSPGQSVVGFESPYYSAKSALFTIKKGDTTPISLTASLANVKISVEYTTNVTNDFTNWKTTVSTEAPVSSLLFDKNETRSGYFNPGKLSVVVDLTYTKSTGEIVAMQLKGTIDNAKAKEYYKVKVDAVLKDGVITPLILNADGSTVDINFDLTNTTTPPPPTGDFIEGTMVDARDNQTYKTVQIGTQVWLAENLKYNASGSVFPNNNATLGATYGRWYTWTTATTSNVCPSGWHVASTAEFDQLITHLGGVVGAGGKVKEAGTSHWNAPNTGATNEAKFSALPAGGGGTNPDGSNAQFWTSTENANTDWGDRKILGSASDQFNGGAMTKSNYASVRCVKN